jgi:ABC-type glycerol-3-phosphate transport system substrate-binding protein
MKTKRLLGLFLAITLVFSLLAPAALAESGKRNIVIGLWWDRYYDSTSKALEDNPSYQGLESDQLMFDVVKKVEEKYNVTIEYVNMTYIGLRESVNTSILAGTPECDIYLVDTSIGIPAAMNGYCIDLKTILPQDSDIFGKKVVMNYLDLGDGKASMMKPVAAQSLVEATYPLMFNLQMIQDANLEDPRELYKRGEWTWDKFIEYCQKLTKDSNGDGIIDVYGYGGFQVETFDSLMMSNGTHVATDAKENFSSPEVGEVLKLMQDMYLTYKCAYPYDSVDPSNTMRWLYRDGKVAMCPGAAWILAQNADYNWDGTAAAALDFDMCFVPWPVGPSGNQETNKMKLSAGEYYMIPVGTKDPELVYNVFYDFTNWYNFDTTIRDDAETLGWWYGVTGRTPEIQNQNFDVMFQCGLREQFDLVDSLTINPDFAGFFNGDYTPAQFQETYKQQYQDALDRYFKK